MIPADAAGAIAELESPGDYDGILAAATPAMPHAVITNFAPFGDHGLNPRPLLERGYACLTEAYIGSNPNATPPNMNGLAQAYGWANSQPAFGLYDAPLSTYQEWIGWPGCDYVVENVL